MTRAALEAATPMAEEWVEKVVADEFAKANSLWWASHRAFALTLGEIVRGLNAEAPAASQAA